MPSIVTTSGMRSFAATAALLDARVEEIWDAHTGEF